MLVVSAEAMSTRSMEAGEMLLCRCMFKGHVEAIRLLTRADALGTK